MLGGGFSVHYSNVVSETVNKHKLEVTTSPTEACIAHSEI